MSSKTKVTSLRATGQAPAARPLPDAARHQLADLVIEVRGVAMVLRTEVVVHEDDAMYTAVSMWLGRIAQDLESLEGGQYPIDATEAE